MSAVLQERRASFLTSVRRRLLASLLPAALLCLPASSFGADAAGPPGAKRAGGGVCAEITKLLKEGAPARVVVRSAVEIGHGPCLVVRCALEAGGDLEGIVLGAVEAGAGPDVVSRCAVDAGADPVDLAGVFLLPELGLNLCYFAPPGEEAEEAPPPSGRAPLPPLPYDPFSGRDDRRNPISPHAFGR